jgi:hypothetical protein
MTATRPIPYLPVGVLAVGISVWSTTKRDARSYAARLRRAGFRAEAVSQKRGAVVHIRGASFELSSRPVRAVLTPSKARRS